MKDLKSKIDAVTSIAPAAITTTVTGAGVNILGYESALVLITPGTITDGTHTPKLQESDDDSTYTDVAAADLHGAFAAISSDTPQKVGYKGIKRYLRVVSTVAGASTGGVYSAHIVRGNAHLQPL